MNYIRTLTTKGQVTVPAAIRKALGLKPHDRVSFRLDDGVVRLEPAESIVLARYGIAKLKRPFKDWKELRRETEKWVADEAMKEM